jgi:adenylate kinase family enzyme
MTVKLFVLGLPGSGKSTIAREIAKNIDDRGLESFRVNDYAILEQMYYDDVERKKFRAADYGGFDVIDLAVIDAALEQLEQFTQNLISYKPEGVILIEFARNDYRRAFRLFSDAFLQDAYFLYLDTEIETCKKRIRNRINSPSYNDDYYVSEYIFDTYYNNDDGKCLSQILINEYGIDKQHERGIDNNSSLEEALRKITPFIDMIFDPQSADQNALAQPEGSIRRCLLPMPLVSSW